jgi:predicted N-acetyltransferase YhbS
LALALDSPLAPLAPLYRPESAADAGAIEGVLDRAFGPGRFAKPSERVREFARPNPGLSRCVWRGAALVGCCRLYDIRIGGAPALFLGPLAIDPAAQHHGLGHDLTRAALAACRAAGAGAVILMGEPSFFTGLGFSNPPEGRVIMPAPVEARRLHWIALAAGALESLGGAVGPA